VLVHTARMVNTPWGICSAGMILINPALKEVPDFFGFVAENEELGKYYGDLIYLKALLLRVLLCIRQNLLLKWISHSTHTQK